MSSIHEEKLSLMSSLKKTWGKLQDLGFSPDNTRADRWEGMSHEIGQVGSDVDRVADGIQRMNDSVRGNATNVTGVQQGARDVQKAAVKLSEHIIIGTDIADNVMRDSVVQPDHDDAEITQNWTEALRFVDAFCLESQRHIGELASQNAASDDANAAIAYDMGVAAGSMTTASQVARQQFERGIRMSLKGPLAEYAAASALENGMTERPEEAVYGLFRTVYKNDVIVESIQNGQLFAVPVSVAEIADLQAAALEATGLQDDGFRGKPVVYAYDKHNAYTRHDPLEFAARCRIKAAHLNESAGHQDGEAYRSMLKESERFAALANLIDPTSSRPAPRNAESQGAILPGATPVRTREEIVSIAIAKMNQALGYSRPDPVPEIPVSSTDHSLFTAAFHLDERGAVIWDTPRKEARLASAGYSILPVIYSGASSKPWICMDGEQPTKLMVEHEGREMAVFPAQDMNGAMAYVNDAKAGASHTMEDFRATLLQPARLEHAFHLGMLERLDNPRVTGPEVDDARNGGLASTVRAITKDANANVFAIVEADAAEVLDTESAVKHRLFAVPVSDADSKGLVIGAHAVFRAPMNGGVCEMVNPIPTSSQLPDATAGKPLALAVGMEI